MVAKAKAKPATKEKSRKVATAKAAPKPVKVRQVSKNDDQASEIKGWLQDASIEVPMPTNVVFVPGQRELEFSVGLRQQAIGTSVRSELRGRALVHADGQVLALVEASFVALTEASESKEQSLPIYLYSQLKPRLEGLLELAGHTPPLPESLEQVG